MRIFTIIFALAISMAALSSEDATKYNNFISPSSKSYFIQHETGEIFQIKFLKTRNELAKGFSGIRSQQVEKYQGIFFYFPTTDKRSFWMPDTYFDLKIIYLNEALKVLETVEKAPHHPGYSEKDAAIFRAPEIIARHVLEIRADSPMGKNIKKGSQFKWIKDLPFGFQQK